MKPIYLDYNATTPIDPDVLDAMLPYLRDQFGNPSSSHVLGRHARDAVEKARGEVAGLIGADAGEIIFTSGGTEASNLAIFGVSRRVPEKRAIVTTAVEHPATEAACAALERRGHPVRRVRPRPDGCVDAGEMTAEVTRETAFVTMIHAQNEVGTLQPVAEVAAAARRHNVPMHIDAAQSVGKIAIDVHGLGIDLLSIAGHKLYAPKGVGALFVRRGVSLGPYLVGAGQEQGRRPGTENVAGIVALGRACAIAAQHVAAEGQRLAALRDDLLARLRAQIPRLLPVGHSVRRLPNTLNVLFPDASGRRLLEACPGVLASNGSACHADREDPSDILLALGLSRDEALGAVRLSLGRGTTADDVREAAARLTAAWRQVSAPAAVAV